VPTSAVRAPPRRRTVGEGPVGECIPARPHRVKREPAPAEIALPEAGAEVLCAEVAGAIHPPYGIEV